jgi:hypothetical protein
VRCWSYATYWRQHAAGQADWGVAAQAATKTGGEGPHTRTQEYPHHSRWHPPACSSRAASRQAAARLQRKGRTPPGSLIRSPQVAWLYQCCLFGPDGDDERVVKLLTT